MKILRNKGLWALCLFCVWPGGTVQASQSALDPQGRRIVAGELLVKTKASPVEGHDDSQWNRALEAVHRSARARVKRVYAAIPNLALVNVDDTFSLESAIAAYKQSGFVEAVSYNFIRKAAVLPDDTLLGDGKQWGLENAGQLGGIEGADISASEAWDIVHDATSVTIAILDSGIRYTHEDLAQNMWVNTGEIQGNGVDDDNNGYIDDVHGINTVGFEGSRTPENEGDPMDDLGHGTHIAGIAGAVGNNGVGVSGVAWATRLMALKFLDTQGDGTDADAIECINYALIHGADIINSSWGGLDFNPLLADAIGVANEAGVYFVAAAGNESRNNDDSLNYPSSYAHPNVVSVTATDKRNGFASFANYGETEVELAAPGVGIYSTYFNSDSDYRALSGTSMATPFVSGAIALMLTHFPGEPMANILNRLYSSTDTLESLARRCRTGGRLNLARALQAELPKPRNDEFSDAYEVSNAPFIVTGFNTSASQENGEPTHDAEATGSSVWWKWTADGSGLAEISSEGSDFNTVLVVYQGDEIDSLQLVAKDRDVSIDGSGASIVFDALEGTTYHIAVDGLQGESGNVSLSIGQSAVNDDFENALEVEGINVRVVGENIAATREENEPQHIENAFGSKSVWWKWTAPLSGNVTISTSSSNSFDTMLAVYVGDSYDELQLVSANDDDERTGVWTSILTFYAREGVEYRIAVDGWNGGFGEIALTVAMAEHDDFEDSRRQYSDTFVDYSFTNFATKELSEASHGGSSVGRSLWWQWTATRSGQAEISTFGSDFDTTVAVYEGDALSNLNLLGENDDGGSALTSRLAMEVEVGETYWVAVDGNDFRDDRSYGLAQLNIDVREASSTATPYIADPGEFSVVAAQEIVIPVAASRDAETFTADGLPDGLSIHPGTGVISGTPTESGRFEVLIEATNSEGTGAFLYVLEVAPPVGSPSVQPLPLEVKGMEGAPLNLDVDAEDSAGIAYQWFKDGIAIDGEDQAVLSFDALTGDDEGEYTVEVSNEVGPVVAGPVRLRMIRESLFNISTRGMVGSGSEIMIAGFIVSGSESRRVLIRGLGATLEQNGVSGALEDPQLVLYNSLGQKIGEADDWVDSPNREEIETVSPAVGASPLVDPSESAMLVVLDPGLYTVHLFGKNGGTGIGLVEVFDSSEKSIETRMVNISTRLRSSTGNEVAIGGFVITGTDPKRVLIRALGPELSKSGLDNYMPDPIVTLYRGLEPVAENDDWSDEFVFQMREAFTQVGASQLDEGNRDAAMICELQPGLYTAIVTDFNNEAGITLIEVFELP